MRKLTIRKLTIRKEGRHDYGNPVQVARCGCGWVWMRSHPRFHPRGAKLYLIRRYNAHACSPPIPTSGRKLTMTCDCKCHRTCHTCGKPFAGPNDWHSNCADTVGSTSAGSFASTADRLAPWPTASDTEEEGT